jgi:sigma-B regulation protein RsbU (phosphoserine phosphatase)
MSKDEEEWGEERLVPAVAAHASERSVDIVPSLLADRDRFVSGAPQHDDLTLVVLKIGG